MRATRPGASPCSYPNPSLAFFSRTHLTLRVLLLHLPPLLPCLAALPILALPVVGFPGVGVAVHVVALLHVVHAAAVRIHLLLLLLLLLLEIKC